VRLALLVLSLCFVALRSSGSTEIRLAVVRVEAGGAERVAGRLRFDAYGGPSGARLPPPVELAFTAPGEASVALDRRFFWQLSAEAAGFWVASQLLSPASLEREVEVRLLPAGTLRGRLLVERGEASPAHVEVRLEETPRLGPADGTGRVCAAERSFAAARVRCPVTAAGVFRCPLPAGRLDLSIRTSGKASRFFWEKALAPGGQLDLGELKLSVGASLVGWVATRHPPSVDATCEVELSAAQTGASSEPLGDQRRQQRALRTHTDARGFFAFEGLPAGSYSVTARQPGFAPTSLRGVPIAAGAETRLRETLLLAVPAALDVSLEPPFDPEGAPWQVELSQLGRPGRRETLRRAPAVDGALRLEGLAQGTYGLRVLDRRGTAYFATELEFPYRGLATTIRLDLVELEGRVLLGDEPVAARLFFGGRRGRESISFESDAEGRFRGLLPRAGRWNVDILAPAVGVDRRWVPVEVTSPLAGAVARTEIRLGVGRLEGEVVDGEGRPAPRAAVSVTPLDRSEESVEILADAAGRFEAGGLSRGRHRVEASLDDETADPLELKLDEERADRPVRLVLRPSRALRGRVLAGSEPVVQARVQAVPLLAGGQEAVTAPVVSVSSAADGSFEVSLPAWARGAVLEVAAPGFGYRQLAWAELPREAVVVAVAQDGGNLVLGRAPDLDGALVLLGPSGHTLLGLEATGWRAAHGEAAPNRLPNLGPGRYQACWFPSLDEQRRAFLAPSPPRGACADGTLVPGGELELSPPPP
jgi:hypothetical protein